MELLSVTFSEVAPWYALGWLVAFGLGFAIGSYYALLFPAAVTAYFVLPPLFIGCDGTDDSECVAGTIVELGLLAGGGFAAAMLAGILIRRRLVADP
jgi:hypothetical protein